MERCRLGELVERTAGGQLRGAREVDPDSIAIERDLRTIDLHPPTAHRRSQCRQSPAERAARRLVVRIGPQEGRQLVARERAAVGCEERHNREGLPGVDHERRFIGPHLERPEQADVEDRSGSHERNGTASGIDPVTFPERSMTIISSMITIRRPRLSILGPWLLRAIVDRRFDRSRIDRERIAAAFHERLRDELDPGLLIATLVRTADGAVRPDRVTLWLRARSE
jgi:hypothetical protein